MSFGLENNEEVGLDVIELVEREMQGLERLREIAGPNLPNSLERSRSEISCEGKSESSIDP